MQIYGLFCRGDCVKKDVKLYLKLFKSTFYLSAFTFGGGYVIVPLMKSKFVDELNWIEEQEMMDITAIAQTSPGAMAVNASILIGYKIAGFLGALVTVLGTILPPLIILSVISFFYIAFKQNLLINFLLKGMQAGIAAVIADVVISMAQSLYKGKNVLSIIILAAAFIATYFFNINVVIIILLCAVTGVIVHFIKQRNKKGGNEI